MEKIFNFLTDLFYSLNDYAFRMAVWIYASYPDQVHTIGLTVAGLITTTVIWRLIKHVIRLGKRNRLLWLGVTDKNKDYLLTDTARTGHVQVIGTTSAGKTESVIFPWLMQDLSKGRGALIIDGKADSGFLRKLLTYAKHLHREHDVRWLTLADPEASATFNPFVNGEAGEVVERIFNSFEFENEYFKNLQFETFHLLKLPPSYLENLTLK